MDPLTAFPVEIAATVGDGTTWLAIGLGILLTGVALAFGYWLAHRVGLLPPEARVGETIAVGLGVGLLVLTAWWAVLASGGRSAYTPVAIGFVLTIALAPWARCRRGNGRDVAHWHEARTRSDPGPTERRGLILGAAAAVAFIVVVGLLFGAVMAPSPHDGAQPLPFRDPAFYAFLGQDLTRSGLETNTGPSGFSNLPGLPTQLWYHWGDLWLASAISTLFGTPPFASRYFAVLPLLLAAAASLAGAFVQRMTRPSSPGTFLFGFLACLVLAPMPWIGIPFLERLPLTGSLTVGMLYGINNYGLAAVAVLLGMYVLTVGRSLPPTWPLASFIGCTAGAILASHIAVAMLAVAGVASVALVQAWRSLRDARRLPSWSLVWRRSGLATTVALIATVGWGWLTGHAVPTSPVASSTTAFNSNWLVSVAVVVLGAGAFIAIPIEWVRTRRSAPRHADLYLGTTAILAGGAIGWGIRDGDYNQYYLFLGAITVFGAPAAAIATWSIWTSLRRVGRTRLATMLLVLCVAQMELGTAVALQRVGLNGPSREPAVPLDLLAIIRDLPADARVAYACRSDEEATYGTPNLLALSVYGGHPLIPMCFERDLFGAYASGTLSSDRPNADVWAPQKSLYPNADARPSSEQVAAFMREHGIGYIFVSSRYPNTLVAGAVPITTSGEFQLLQLR